MLWAKGRTGVLLGKLGAGEGSMQRSNFSFKQCSHGRLHEVIFKQSIEGMSLQISRGRVLEPEGTANAEVRAHQVQVSNGKL